VAPLGGIEKHGIPPKGGTPNLHQISNDPDESKTNRTMTDPDPEQGELAHSIIESLLDHTRVVSDLIALMAQALDQETAKALTQTPQWQDYLESRRRMEQTRADVESFVKSFPQAE
jgi:hypothetical protein